MNNLLKKAVTGLVAGAALVGAVAAPAEARGYYRGGYGYHHGIGRGGAAVLGGIAGLAVGAAIASPRYNYAPAYGYGGGYGGGYGYAPPPQAYYGYGGGYYEPCRPRVIWDPYIGQYVRSRGC